jgi:hypothetical protein
MIDRGPSEGALRPFREFASPDTGQIYTDESTAKIGFLFKMARRSREKPVTRAGDVVRDSFFEQL